MRIVLSTWGRRFGRLFGVAAAGVVVILALALLDGRIPAVIDSHSAIAAGFRTGALAIDPVADWRIGPRRGFDCALLQGGLPAEAETLALALPRYDDPRNLAEDCEVLRDVAIRDPIARYEYGADSADISFGHGLITLLLTLAPIPLLRWGIAGLWLAAPLLGFLLARRSAAPDDSPDFGDPVGMLFAPLLAVACLWLWGPSLSAALPVALLLVLAAWAGASPGLRVGSGGAQFLAALFGAALALSEYRAPAACCGLAVLLLFAVRRGRDRTAAMPVLAFAMGAILSLVAWDAAAILVSSDRSVLALAETLLDRLDPASDPIDPVQVKAAMVDAMDASLPGPRSIAMLAFLAIAFGLLFAPALARASQSEPMPVGRIYAALAGFAAIAAWVAWFGGTSALAPAEGGVIYAWLGAAAMAAVLDWLWSLARLLMPRRAALAA